MNRTQFVVITSFFLGLSISQSHSETTAKFFSKYVNAERVRVCADSSIPTCNQDFGKPARLAERLDAQEKIAKALENGGENEKALQMRRQILVDAIVLDFLLDSLIVLHQKGQDTSGLSRCRTCSGDGIS